MSNTPGRAWIDEDGKHIWFLHQCADGEIHYDMLPWPHWQNNKQRPAFVTPSIVCTIQGCNFHSIPEITDPPPDWKPRLTLEELASRNE